MSAELVEAALKLPKYRQQIEDAEIQVPVRDDPRTDEKQKGQVKTMRESHYEPKAKAVKEEEKEHPMKEQMGALGINIKSDEEADKEKEQDLQATVNEMKEQMAQLQETLAGFMAVKS